MADKVWTLPQATPLDPSAMYDGLRLLEIVLRFPEGAPSGGEVQIARLRGGQVMLQQRVTIPLEPGEPDAVRATLDAFVDAVLKRANVVGADVALTEVAPPPPLPPTEPTLGRL